MSELWPMNGGFSLNGGVRRLSLHINVHASFRQQSISKKAPPPFPPLPATHAHSILLFFATIRLQRLSCRGISPDRFRFHFVTTLILMNWLHKALRQHTLSPVINSQIHSFLFIWGIYNFVPCAPDEPAASGEIVLQTTALSTLSWQMQFEHTWQNSQQKH